jgi:hypothetical protein
LHTSLRKDGSVARLARKNHTEKNLTEAYRPLKKRPPIDRPYQPLKKRPSHPPSPIIPPTIVGIFHPFEGNGDLAVEIGWIARA